MITINDLREKNKDRLLRLNAYETQGKSNLKMLIFDVDLTHIHETIPMIDCPLTTDSERRSVHALWCGSVVKTMSPDIELYSLDYTGDFEKVVDWCIENDIRVINSSFRCSYRREKDLNNKNDHMLSKIVTLATNDVVYAYASADCGITPMEADISGEIEDTYMIVKKI